MKQFPYTLTLLTAIMAASGCGVFTQTRRESLHQDAEAQARTEVATFFAAVDKAAGRYLEGDALPRDIADAVISDCETQFNEYENTVRQYLVTAGTEASNYAYAIRLADERAITDREKTRRYVIALVLKARCKQPAQDKGP